MLSHPRSTSHLTEPLFERSRWGHASLSLASRRTVTLTCMSASEDRREWDPYAPPPVEALTGVATPEQDGDVWPDLDEVEPPEHTGDPKTAAAEIPDDLDDISKDDLIALAELAGVATYGTKAQIAARIKAA